MAQAILKQRHLATTAWICLLITGSVLLISLSAQFVFRIKPCTLCVAQRIPYCVLMIVLPYLFSRKWARYGLVVIPVTLATSCTLALYHLLVIAGLLPDSCIVPNAPQTIEQFQNMLDAPLPCSISTWKFLGVPMAGYNLIVSATMLIFVLLRFNALRKS